MTMNLREIIHAKMLGSGSGGSSGGGGGGNEASVLDAMIDGSITEISSNTVTTINKSAFTYCSNLITASFPAVSVIWDSAFAYCSNLITANFPAVTSIKLSAFYGCSKLTSVDYPLLTNIAASVFNSCSKLTAVILRNDTVVTLSNESALRSTPISSGKGYIYVPLALVDTYKAATNWSTYADQFRALEDYTVDGTITGELDPNKT